MTRVFRNEVALLVSLFLIVSVNGKNVRIGKEDKNMMRKIIKDIQESNEKKTAELVRLGHERNLKKVYGEFFHWFEEDNDINNTRSDDVGDPNDFVPGNLNILDLENGILLSQGLQARTIGIGGRKVRYADGKKSNDFMHVFPDMAGCFDMDDGSGRYVYTSNSEVPFGFIFGAGVGSFIFESNGDLVEYKRVLKHRTSLNCGGGKTPWGTWLSGEEFGRGDVWEVDPLGERKANRTVFGVNEMHDLPRGRKFESAICDDRNMTTLTCYATIDDSNGELRRLTPDPDILGNAIETNEYSQVLTSLGTLDYLLLDDDGSFTWTQNLTLAQQNAEKYYKNLEGIDHVDGILYVVSKKQREIISLSLDNFTYVTSSTVNGTFDNQPDQIAHILTNSHSNSSDGVQLDMMYFVEDGGTMPGVFARDMDQEYYYAILEKLPQKLPDEITGLAFCKNYQTMIIGIQRYNLLGKILEITRKDGQPFTGVSLNVRAHRFDFE